MKKYLSVFGLLAKSSFYKILLILLGSSLLQITAYALLLQRETERALTTPNLRIPDVTVGMLFSPLLFGTALLLVTLVMQRFGSEAESRTEYTLNRLRIEPQKILHLRFLYQLLIYLLLWMTEILSLFVMCLIYLHTVPSVYISDQLLLLAFYSHGFLHGTLPLGVAVLWVRNTTLLTLLSLFVCRPVPTEKKPYVLPSILSLMIALFWSNDLQDVSTSLFLTLLGICVIACRVRFLQKAFTDITPKGNQNPHRAEREVNDETI